jgi:hypothetical protein
MNSRNPFVGRIFPEGSTSPLPARLMLQIFNLRDRLIHEQSERRAFDDAYSGLLDNFMELKLVVTRLQELQSRHLKEIEEGSAARIMTNHQITLLRPIDTEYRSLFKEFFIKGEMTISGISHVGKVLGVRAGFFFADPKKFKKGVDKLRQDWPHVYDLVIPHLEHVRSTWYGSFNKIRNDIEHKTLKLPTLTYQLTESGNASVLFPRIEQDLPMTESFENLVLEILELVEDCVVFFLATRLRPGQFIRMIPENEQDPSMVIKYKLFMRIGDQDVPLG